MPQVHITNLNKTIEVKPLTKLWEIPNIVFVRDPNCGGSGKCHQCRCKVNGEMKLSCMERVWEEDIELETLIMDKKE